MKQRSGKRSISALAALVMLAVFAAGMLGVLLSGAGIYERLVETSAVTGNSRTCTQYLAAKVRQAPAPGCVSLSEFGDGDALLIQEEIGGQPYQTRIYCLDGWMMELFTAADAGLAPEDGEKILPVLGLDAGLEDGLLRLEITETTDLSHTLLLALPGNEEGGV